LSRANVKPTKSKPRLLMVVVGVLRSSASEAIAIDAMLGCASGGVAEFELRLWDGLWQSQSIVERQARDMLGHPCNSLGLRAYLN